MPWGWSHVIRGFAGIVKPALSGTALGLCSAPTLLQDSEQINARPLAHHLPLHIAGFSTSSFLPTPCVAQKGHQ